MRRGWLLAAIVLVACAPGPSGAEQQQTRGEELYEAKCLSCHGGATGGDIADIPPRHNAEGHTWHHPDCKLVEIVQEGVPARPELPAGTPTMPVFGDQLTDEDVRAILAFVKTWWTDEQREFQREVTGQVCE